MKDTTNFRVFKLSEQDRNNLTLFREQHGSKNEAVIGESVDAHLPALVNQLLALGFGPDDEKKRPARLPISDETLAHLKDASEETGLPQTLLLTLCLKNHCRTAPTEVLEDPRSRGGRRKATEAQREAAKKPAKRTSRRAAQTRGKTKEKPAAAKKVAKRVSKRTSKRAAAAKGGK